MGFAIEILKSYKIRDKMLNQITNTFTILDSAYFSSATRATQFFSLQNNNVYIIYFTIFRYYESYIFQYMKNISLNMLKSMEVVYFKIKEALYFDIYIPILNHKIFSKWKKFSFKIKITYDKLITEWDYILICYNLVSMIIQNTVSIKENLVNK